MKIKKLTKCLAALLAMTAALTSALPAFASTPDLKALVSSGVSEASDETAELTIPEVSPANSLLAAAGNTKAAQYPDIFSNNAEVNMLYYTNVVRVLSGAEMLSSYSSMQYCADVRCKEMASSLSSFSNTRPNGKSFETVLSDTGISYDESGEMIGRAYDSSDEFFSELLDDQSYVDDMVIDSYSHLGTGVNVYDTYPYTDVPYYELFFMGDCQAQSLGMWNWQPCFYLNPGDSLDDQHLFFITTCKHGTGYFPLIEDALTNYNKNLYNQVQNVTMNYRGASYTFKVMIVDRSQFNFADVQPSDWYYSSINYVYTHDIMKGLNSSVFGATSPVTRGQFATILYRLEGSPAASEYGNFMDVAPNTYYAKAINWANKAGIVSGFSATKFAPEASITREQMAMMMFRYATYLGQNTSKRASINTFNDAYMVSAYAKDAISWAVAEGLINGLNATTLAPQYNASRAECAAIIQRFDEKFR